MARESAKKHTREHSPRGIFRAELSIDAAQIKETMASVFNGGRYPAEIQALLEFTDNSAAYRNKKKSGQSTITVSIGEDSVKIRDEGGDGTGREGIEQFLKVANSKRKGVSIRGAGGKCAAWYLGKDLIIRAKEKGTKREYKTAIHGFGDPKKIYKGRVGGEVRVSKLPEEVGFFEIEIKRLKHSDRLPVARSIVSAMAEVYRPLLVDQAGEKKLRKTVSKDGKTVLVDDKIVLQVQHSDGVLRQVEPMSIPLKDGDENALRYVRTNKGELISYWVGQVDGDIPASSHVKPGLRFYYDGRLVDIDFCNFPSKDARLQSLVGEVNLDHVMGIKNLLSLNKSAGVNKDTAEWERVQRAIHKAIGPYVNALLAKKIETVFTTPKFFSEAIANVKSLLADSISQLKMEGALKGAAATKMGRVLNVSPIGVAGTVFDAATVKEKTTTSGSGGGRGGGEKKEKGEKGAGKAGRGKDEVTTTDEEGDVIRSIDVEENPESKDAYRFVDGALLLNASNPMVKAKLLHELDTTIMIGEAISDVLADQVTDKLDEYKRIKRRLLVAFGEQIKTHPTFLKVFPPAL